MFACQKFRIYILGYPIELYTDHQALTFLFTCKLRNARLSRWTLLLQEYNLKIRHCPGKENPVDTLSRYPVGRDDVTDNRQPVILSMTIPPTLPSSITQILHRMSYEQRQDAKLLKIRNNLYDNNRLSTQLSKYYLVYNDIIFIRKSDHRGSPWSIYTPKHLEKMLIIAFHEYYGHPGSVKTAHAVRQHIYFGRFFRTIREVVRACDICQRSKVINYNPEGDMVSVLVENKLDRVLVDIYGPLPTGQFRYAYILVVLDNFTRFVKLFPLCKATAKACVNKIITNYIPMFGKPKTIISDHGKQFISKIWQQSLRKLEVQPYMTSVYHPQSNPAERVMREIGRLFRTYCYNQHQSWAKYVEYVQWVLNNVRHESTHSTPAELFLNIDCKSPLADIIDFPPSSVISNIDRITIAREVQCTNAERRREEHRRRGHSIYLSDW